jgi:hypothetical protein
MKKKSRMKKVRRKVKKNLNKDHNNWGFTNKHFALGLKTLKRTPHHKIKDYILVWREEGSNGKERSFLATKADSSERAYMNNYSLLSYIAAVFFTGAGAVVNDRLDEALAEFNRDVKNFMKYIRPEDLDPRIHYPHEFNE